MSLRSKVQHFWVNRQTDLFPQVEEELGQRSGGYEQLLHVLVVVPVERLLPSARFRRPGRPQQHCTLLARAFLVKMVLDVPTTTAWVERLRSDRTFRCLCGWERGVDVPSEATFSRAFAEFAESDLPVRLHADLIKAGCSEQLVGHISRDSPAIVTRAKPAPVEKLAEAPPKRKRGRPRKGGGVPQSADAAGTSAYDGPGGEGR